MGPAVRRIALFYGIAIACSWYFRVHDPQWYRDLVLPFGLTPFKYLLEGLGPALGALVVIGLFKPKRNVTLFGTSRKWSLLMAALPVLLLALIGVGPGEEGGNAHVHGLIVGLLSVGYVVLEECGWRGYLLDEVRGLGTTSVRGRALLIGMLWYVWHLTPWNAAGIGDHFIFLGMLVFASWGFEKITDTTGSVVSAACFHLLGSLLSTNVLLQNGLSSTARLVIFGICLVVWIAMVSKWPGRAPSGDMRSQVPPGSAAL
ncbi:MAG: CPBP family intramembrane metalloprotease [Flavobacteriales bacterium]|nr:CPBP family intramembrane metalloprotease [Flavobacteriales bacterium]